MNTITVEKAAHYASMCQYWEVRDAESGFTLATSQNSPSFVEKLEELMSNANFKAFKLNFGSNKSDSRRVTFLITTSSYSEEEDYFVMQPPQQRGFAGFGNAAPGSSTNKGIPPETTQMMIAAAVQNALAEQMQSQMSQQFEFMQKMLSIQVQQETQRMNFEREKIEMERKHMEEMMNMRQGRESTLDKFLNGIIKIAPAALGLAGIKLDKDEEEDEPEEEQKPKGSMSFKIEEED